MWKGHLIALSEIDMNFAVPLGFHDDVANLDDAVLGEGIAQVLYGRREQLVGFALRMLIVEASKLGVVVAYAVGRGLHEALTFNIKGTHAGVYNIFLNRNILLAAAKEQGQRGEA